MTSYLQSLRPARLTLLALASVVATSAHAVLPHAPEGVAPAALAQLGEPPRISPAIDADESKQWAATDPAFRAFVSEAGAEWSARWDRRTGHLSFASGTFPAWLPADHRAREAGEIASTRALLEQRARDLMARHADLLALPASAKLVLDESRSVPVDDGRIWQIDFRVELGGVPVTGAHVSFRLNSGRLVQLGQQGIADGLEIMDVTPRLDAASIARRAEEDLATLLGPERDGLHVIAEPRLELLPVAADPWRFDGATGSGLDYRLAWRTTLRDPAAIETWVLLHDAITGERLFVFDSNRYVCTAPSSPQGRVIGGIYAGPIEEVPETIHGMPYAEVNNGGVLNADVNGVFPFSVGTPATTTLSGQYFDMNCAACSNPSQASAQSQSPGPLTMGVGGNNNTGNGLSTKAERNCFYHLNIIRQIANKHLSDAATGGYLSQRMPATVNIAQNCNAFYDGVGVNFFQYGGFQPTCNNTGEIADVMQHEWGHGLDDHTGGILDGGASEGIGDVVAFMATHDSRMSPYFEVNNPNGIRNADENVATVRTWTQVDNFCPGREVHCVGEIYTQPWWHLASLLRNRAVAAGGTEAAGWFLAEHIFFLHLPLADTMDPNGANNMYDAATLADDDDGDLTNGIPDGTDINAAFSHHAFVSPPAVADSADCTPPATPAVSLSVGQDATTSSWQVTISWTAVAGAVEYRVFRNETGGGGGDVQVATVLAPGLVFRDDDVTDATTYRYRVMAFLGNGCFSIGENVQSTVIPDRLVMGLEAMGIDDSGAGNGNGAPEPGETITLPITARNLSSLAATNVLATLTTTHPGVTIVQGSQNLGDIPAGGSASTSSPHFVISLDRTRVSCPDVVPLRFSFEAAEGCSLADVTLAVGPPPVIDTLETDQGWVVNPAGTDTAGTGIWIRATPIGTSSQVGADHTPGAGTLCFVTGNSGADPGNPGDDDVDDGCTTVESPVYDMGFQSGLTLSYWRAYDIATSLDDQLVVEISNNGGASWAGLESIDAPTGGWSEASISLDTVLGGPANRIKLRFTACDTGARSLVEAAVDDVTFSGFPCVAPDPQPRLSVSTITIGDAAVFGGNGNGNGALDPGEVVRLPIDLRNDGNALATSVTGTLSLLGGPAGVTDASAPWADIAVSQVQTTTGAPPHFAIAIPADAACGSFVDLVLNVDYAGPSGNYSLSHPFTLMIGQVVETVAFSDDFEGGDNGATHFEGVAGNGACAQRSPCDDWHHDVCTGVSAWDAPDTVVPGGKVWGNDLGGDRGGVPYDGNYRRDCCSTLELAPIDCTGRSGLRLGFLRWLTVEGGNFDHARVLVNGNVVWQNPLSPDLLDTQWVPVEYDISTFADNDPAVVIRFDIESDGGLQYGGWNIDDLRVFSRSTDCTPFAGGCGAPPVPPAVGPVLRATPNYDGQGAEYSWVGAPLAPTEEFRLYRGTLPTALNTLVTPAGHVATTFDDRTAPGPLYFYRVVLANCLGQEGPAAP